MLDGLVNFDTEILRQLNMGQLSNLGIVVKVLKNIILGLCHYVLRGVNVQKTK